MVNLFQFRMGRRLVQGWTYSNKLHVSDAAEMSLGVEEEYLVMMITHHQGAVNMAQTELAQGTNPTARQLAQQIISAQQAEIKEMQTLL